jgi:transcriptional regulator with XRE-family HTH domain
MNHSEIARALGVSRPTVIKWLKGVTFKSDYPGIWEVDGMLHTSVPREWLEFEETDNNR